MSANQSLYEWTSREDLAEFYADCHELSIPGVQYVAELPAALVRPGVSKCARCDEDTPARFMIEHESRDPILQINSWCCPDHAAELVREIGGRPSGTRIEDRQQTETWQSALSATSKRETEREEVDQ